jgi:A/G-specific adenine glycosylase
VLAFAFERDVGVIDANAARVLARWHARPLKRREAQELADAAVPPKQGWSWNQAMLDLGATVCTARNPSCGSCAVAATCGWARDGRPEPDPSVGTFGVSGRQSRFADSDRQGRGRLVDALRSGPVTGADLAAAMGWPADPQRAERVAVTLVADGLVRCSASGVWHLA